MTKMLCLGDSITVGWTGVTTAKVPYPEYIGKQLNWEIDNKGASATSAVNGPDSLLKRLKNFDLTTYDAVMISYGTNDYGLENVNLRDFKIGYEQALKYIKGSNPKLNIYILLPIQSWILSGSMDTPNKMGVSQNDICNAERDIANKMGFRFLDWRDDPILKAKNRFEFFGDGVLHPKEWVLHMMGDYIIRKVIDYG